MLRNWLTQWWCLADLKPAGRAGGLGTQVRVGVQSWVQILRDSRLETGRFSMLQPGGKFLFQETCLCPSGLQLIG